MTEETRNKGKIMGRIEKEGGKKREIVRENEEQKKNGERIKTKKWEENSEATRKCRKGGKK